MLLFLLVGLRPVGQLWCFFREFIKVILVDSNCLNIKSKLLTFVEQLLLFLFKVTILAPATRCRALSLLNVYCLNIAHHSTNSFECVISIEFLDIDFFNVIFFENSVIIF